MFSLGGVAVPRGYLCDGCLDADGPASGRADFLIATGAVVCRGLGSGIFGGFNSVVSRFVVVVVVGRCALCLLGTCVRARASRVARTWSCSLGNVTVSFPARALRVTCASRFSIRWNVRLERSFMSSNSLISSLERSFLLARRVIFDDSCEQIAADV